MFALTLMVGLALSVIGSHVLNAQQAPPTEAKGQTAKSLTSVDLGPEIPGLQGRYLRARLLITEPGGHSAVHSHTDRPTIAYVLQGTLTLCTPAGRCERLQEGQARAEGRDTVHWGENRGMTPLVFLVVDIAREP